MKFYDFVEVGTSDFDTEIQKHDDKIGISIEPIQYYLQRLPEKKGCLKLHMGISNYNGTCVVNYLSEETIQAYGFPFWVRGCNSINSYHQTVSDLCKERCIDISKIVTADEVKVSTLYEIIKEYCCRGLYYLKIDTEGHDVVILKKFYEDIQNNFDLPHVILFETNTLSNIDEVNQIISLFQSKGYDLISRNHDTTLQLNLQKLQKKNIFSEGIARYFIMEYPPNYDIKQLPHENTLEAAQEYCVKHNCSGVTLQDGIYQVRGGKYLQFHNSDIYTWVLL